MTNCGEKRQREPCASSWSKGGAGEQMQNTEPLAGVSLQLFPDFIMDAGLKPAARCLAGSYGTLLSGQRLHTYNTDVLCYIYKNAVVVYISWLFLLGWSCGRYLPPSLGGIKNAIGLLENKPHLQESDTFPKVSLLQHTGKVQV